MDRKQLLAAQKRKSKLQRVKKNQQQEDTLKQWEAFAHKNVRSGEFSRKSKQ